MQKNYFTLLLVLLITSCTQDRDTTNDVILNPNLEIIHDWDFNDAANLTTPTSTTGGTSVIYNGTTFDEVEGTPLNARETSEAGTALRLRNPSNDIIITMPTLGYKEVVLSYATMRTGSGAQNQTLSYTTDGSNFTTAGLSDFEMTITEVYVLRQFNFAGIPNVKNNPNFKIKITFSNGNTNASGNNRIDNLVLEGVPSGDTIPDPNQVNLIHFWDFNALPTGTLTTPIPADFSLLTSENASISYPGSGAGYADQFSPGLDLNARNGASAGLGIRFRNPSNTRDVIIATPTTGYKDIVVKFATFRTGSGAQTQNYSYSTDGINYTTAGLTTTTYDPLIEPNFELVTLDFNGLNTVRNNPNFKIKIAFSGTQASGTSGNNRIDNVTVEGKTN